MSVAWIRRAWHGTKPASGARHGEAAGGLCEGTFHLRKAVRARSSLLLPVTTGAAITPGAFEVEEPR